MRNLSLSQKLTAICELTSSSGIPWCDLTDAKAMRIACGAEMDTSVLDEKQAERIESVYHTFFE